MLELSLPMGKKISKISFCILLILTVFNASANQVDVSARVGVVNKSPSIVSIAPRYSPVVIKNNSVQLFFMQIADLDGDTVTYTVTPENWAVAPLNGTLSNATQLQNGNWYINFIYLSSSNSAHLWTSQVTVTLNDGVNPIVIKKIDIYTF